MSNPIKFVKLKQAYDDDINLLKFNITRKLIKMEAYASGKLDSSFDYKIIDKDSNLIAEISASDYFKYIENGRPAGGQPPRSAIKEWAIAKKLPFAYNMKIIGLIAYRIGKYGIKPRPLLDEVVNNMDLSNIEDAFYDDLYDYIEWSLWEKQDSILKKQLNLKWHIQ